MASPLGRTKETVSAAAGWDWSGPVAAPPEVPMRYWLRRLFHRAPRVEPLPNPPWSLRDQAAAMARQRDWMREWR